MTWELSKKIKTFEALGYKIDKLPDFLIMFTMSKNVETWKEGVHVLYNVTPEEWKAAVEEWENLFKTQRLIQDHNHEIGQAEDFPPQHLQAEVRYPNGVIQIKHTDHRYIRGRCGICSGLEWRLDKDYWSF